MPNIKTVTSPESKTVVHQVGPFRLIRIPRCGLTIERVVPSGYSMARYRSEVRESLTFSEYEFQELVHLFGRGILE
jgi:hypothetical protein